MVALTSVDLTELHSGNLFPEISFVIAQSPGPTLILYGIGPQWLFVTTKEEHGAAMNLDDDEDELPGCGCLSDDARSTEASPWAVDSMHRRGLVSLPLPRLAPDARFAVDYPR